MLLQRRRPICSACRGDGSGRRSAWLLGLRRGNGIDCNQCSPLDCFFFFVQRKRKTRPHPPLFSLKRFHFLSSCFTTRGSFSIKRGKRETRVGGKNRFFGNIFVYCMQCGEQEVKRKKDRRRKKTLSPPTETPATGSRPTVPDTPRTCKNRSRPPGPLYSTRA